MSIKTPGNAILVFEPHSRQYNTKVYLIEANRCANNSHLHDGHITRKSFFQHLDCWNGTGLMLEVPPDICQKISNKNLENLDRYCWKFEVMKETRDFLLSVSGRDVLRTYGIREIVFLDTTRRTQF